MKSKQRRIINTAVIIIFLIMAYTSFFPGREDINKDIKDKVFPNKEISKLFKIRELESSKYFYIKDNQNVVVYELNKITKQIEKEKLINFEAHWFNVKKQGMETYLVLLANNIKNEIILFDNDIRLISEKLEPNNN